MDRGISSHAVRYLRPLARLAHTAEQKFSTGRPLKAGIDQCGFHAFQQHGLPLCIPRCASLRHSWATSALAAGIDADIVSRALGYSSIETTAHYYLRPDLVVLKEARENGPTPS